MFLSSEQRNEKEQVYKTDTDPVLIFLDFHEEALSCVTKGATIAEAEGRDIVLLHGIDMRKYTVVERNDPTLRTQIISERTEWLKTFEHQLRQNGQHVRATDLTFKDPRKIISARYAPFIVVALKRVHRSAKIQKSLSDVLIDRPPCDMLIVHAQSS